MHLFNARARIQQACRIPADPDDQVQHCLPGAKNPLQKDNNIIDIQYTVFNTTNDYNRCVHQNRAQNLSEIPAPGPRHPEEDQEDRPENYQDAGHCYPGVRHLLAAIEFVSHLRCFQSKLSQVSNNSNVPCTIFHLANFNNQVQHTSILLLPYVGHVFGGLQSVHIFWSKQTFETRNQIFRPLSTSPQIPETEVP